MQREIEKISILVDNENTVEGILIKCIENNKKKYYSEYVGNKFKEEKDEFYLDEFYLLVTKILFNNNCNKKTEFIHFDDIRYTRIKELIYEHNMTKNTRFKAAVAWSLTCFGFGSPLTGTPSMIYKLLGVSTSIAGLHNINSKIEMFGKSKLKNMLRKFYAITLGLNILSTSIAGYQEFTKTQLERDIEDFIENKDSSIENPFDLDIDYTNSTKIELLMTAIKENPHLKKSDKAILYNLKRLFQTIPYFTDQDIDYQDLYNKFAGLGIIYTEEKDGSYGVGYVKEDNYIIDYDCINEEKNYHIVEISIALIDMIGSLDGYEGLNKGIQRLLINTYVVPEYFANETKEDVIAKQMYQIVGKDKLFQAYFDRDFHIIEKTLKEINNSEEDYEQLVTILNNQFNNESDPIGEINHTFDNYKVKKNKEFQKTKLNIH